MEYGIGNINTNTNRNVTKYEYWRFFIDSFTDRLCRVSPNEPNTEGKNDITSKTAIMTFCPDLPFFDNFTRFFLHNFTKCYSTPTNRLRKPTYANKKWFPQRGSLKVYGFPLLGNSVQNLKSWFQPKNYIFFELFSSFFKSHVHS